MYTLGFFYWYSLLYQPLEALAKWGAVIFIFMKLKITSIFLLLFVFLLATTEVYAQQKQAGTSAAFVNIEITDIKYDDRTKILRKYLEQYNSPLAKHADTFIKEADKYNIDWRLITAISGVESTFAHFLPFNSYNAWGWGIYGDNIYYFKSYDDGIQTISKGIRQDYMNKWGAKDVYQIGRIYAASPTWASRVDYFMEKIDEFAKADTKNTLSLTL